MATRRKRRKKKEEGEIFYRAHPIAPAMPVARPTSRVSSSVELFLWRILGIVEIILLVRLVLAAFGADGGNLLTPVLYSISYPFVVFFFYLFNSLGSISVAAPRFELETLSAMAFYYVVIYIVTQLIGTLRTPESY